MHCCQLKMSLSAANYAAALRKPALGLCRPHPPPPTPQRRRHSSLRVAAETNFHQSRLAASGDRPSALPALQLTVRAGERDDEFEAAAWLRARSFYAYNPERKFAGEASAFWSF